MTVGYDQFVEGAYTLDELPEGDYTVTETNGNVDHYALVSTTFMVDATETRTVNVQKNTNKEIVITNDYKRSEIVVHKVWDESVPANKQVEIMAQLLRTPKGGGAITAYPSEALNAGNQWTHAWANTVEYPIDLDTYDYYVVEYIDDGSYHYPGDGSTFDALYDAVYSTETATLNPVGMEGITAGTVDADGEVTITNGSFTSIEAEKVWDDSANTAPFSHPAITFHLNQNGALMAGKDQTIAADATGEDLKVKWENLPRMNAEGELYTYTVTEEPVENYLTDVEWDATENCYKVTNTYVLPTFIRVEKIWSDGNDKHSNDKVYVTLYQSNVAPDGVTGTAFTGHINLSGWLDSTGADTEAPEGGITFTVTNKSNNHVVGTYNLPNSGSWNVDIPNLRTGTEYAVTAEATGTVDTVTLSSNTITSSNATVTYTGRLKPESFIVTLVEGWGNQPLAEEEVSTSQVEVWVNMYGWAKDETWSIVEYPKVDPIVVITDENDAYNTTYKVFDIKGLSSNTTLTLHGANQYGFNTNANHHIEPVIMMSNAAPRRNAPKATQPSTPSEQLDLPTEKEVVVIDSVRQENIELSATAANGWSYTWAGLPLADDNGDRLYYYVEEASHTFDHSEKVTTTYNYEYAPDGVIRKVIITNTVEEDEKGKITVNKTWAGVTDASDLAALKAGFSITVTGTDAGGSGVNTRTFRFSELPATISDLPLDETYSITEANTATDTLARYTVVSASTTDRFDGVTPAVEGVTKTLVNTYAPKTGLVIFTQKKTFESGEAATAFGYTITEYTDNNFTTVKKNGNEDITYAGTMTAQADGVTTVNYALSDVGDHYYIVKENLPQGTTPTTQDIANGYVIVDDIKYDLTEYRYHVNVSIGGDKLVVKKDNTTVVTNIDSSFTNTRVVKFPVFKKWMSNGTVWNPKYNGGEIKFRLYKQSTTDASQRTQVVPATAGGYETLHMTDTVWMSAADLGIKAENNEGDQKIIVDNLTPETKNGVKGYNIPYMKVFILPKLSDGWEYVAVELTSDGSEELKDSQRNSGTGEFWTCAEFGGVAIKNDLQDVTAKKSWVVGEYYHPAITLDLYRTTDVIPANSWSNGTGYDNVAGISWGEPIRTQTIPAEATGDDLSVTWSDMPKYDLATGNKYTYYVKERSGLGYALNNSQLNGEYTFLFENKRQGKNVDVTKAWRNASGTVIDAWQAEITLTLSRYFKPSSGDIQQDTSFTKTVKLNLPSGTQPGTTTTADGLTVTYEKDNNGFFSFTIGNLDAVGKLNDVSGEWMYMLTETDSAGRLVGYGGADANAPDASIQSIGEGDDDGKIIFNTEPGVALPATGGSGTTVFYILGSALTLLAIVLLITRKRTDGDGID